MVRRNRWTVAAMAALVASLAVACNTAEAQTKPFKIVGAGIAPDGFPFPGSSAPHWAVGAGTFLGFYDGLGAVQNDSIEFLPNGDATGTFESDGPFVFKGADGDKLAVYYGNPDYGPQGTYDLVYLGGPVGPGGTYMAFFVAEFVPYDPDCTGKFKGVSGGWTMYATTEPFVLGATDPIAYEWEGKGSLTFPRK
jgi:hypothetical protein